MKFQGRGFLGFYEWGKIPNEGAPDISHPMLQKLAGFLLKFVLKYYDDETYVNEETHVSKSFCQLEKLLAKPVSVELASCKNCFTVETAFLYGIFFDALAAKKCAKRHQTTIRL